MKTDKSEKNDSEVQQKTIVFIVKSAKRWLNAKRVIFFGSRAKGTNSTLSDYDFAIEPAEQLADQWAYFWNDVEENAPTLNKIDLVNLSSQVHESLRNEIEKTGIELWRAL